MRCRPPCCSNCALRWNARNGKRASGAGRGFCAGADLGGDSLKPGDDVDPARVLVEEYNPLARQIRDLNLPLITQVHGVSAGAGAALALLGDIIDARESAAFIQAYRSIGVIPDAGTAYLLTRALGRVRTLKLMLFGRKLPASKALEWGLITRVVPDAELASTVDALAGELGNAATQSLARIRRMNWQAFEGSLDDQLDLECVLQRELPVRPISEKALPPSSKNVLRSSWDGDLMQGGATCEPRGSARPCSTMAGRPGRRQVGRE